MLKTKISAGIGCLVSIGAAWLVFGQAPTEIPSPVEIDTTPRSVYSNPEPANVTVSTNKKPATSEQQQTNPEPDYRNAPKQNKLRQTVTDEKEYFALATSNDSFTSQDWMLDTVHAQAAWDIMPETGSVVAVIDSGYALGHEDLVNKWHHNSDETGMTELGDACWDGAPKNKQSNNCDDDENGYVDDWRGWDFYDIDNDPIAGATDPNGNGVNHGTLVAGLIGAETNNSLGIASVGRHNTLMPLQVMGDDGVGYTSDIMAAVYYAVDNGAQVINLSLGGADYDNNLKIALDYAETAGVVVIAASGNCGDSTVGFCSGLPAGGIAYPARYRNVIAVGAVNQNNERPGFSSYGSELDVTAPGAGSLISTNWAPDNQTSSYATNLYGTSFASPIVASIAGVLVTTQPDLSPQAIKALLVANATKTAGMNGHFYTEAFGHGIVHAGIATQLGNEVPASITSDLEVGQTGNHIATHRYTHNAVTGSNCTAPATTWCGLWLESTQGHDRYLPFTLTDETGRASWGWNTTALESRIWNIQAISGRFTSTPYILLKK